MNITKFETNQTVTMSSIDLLEIVNEVRKEVLLKKVFNINF